MKRGQGGGTGLETIDWQLFALYLTLVAVGWLMVYTVGYGSGYPDNFAEYLRTPSGRQSIWVVISLAAFFGFYVIDWKFWRTFAYAVYAGSLVLLISVLLFGSTIKGATSWFAIGGFTFQPSEIAKFGTALAVAAYLGTYNSNLRLPVTQITSLTLLVLPVGLILLQPDAGSALVFAGFLVPLYREGLSAAYYVVGFVLATILVIGLVVPSPLVIIIISAIVSAVLVYNFRRSIYSWGSWAVLSGLAFYLYFYTPTFPWAISAAALTTSVALAVWHYFDKKPRLGIISTATLLTCSGLAFAANFAFHNFLGAHQQERINVWLQPGKCDPRGSLYNVLQSKMAIGSGGLTGKGFLQGTMTKLNYVPEQITDFIFCTVGEEQGFLGSAVLILLFFALLWRIVVTAERQRSAFARIFAYSFAGIIFIHVIINIGMTMGLVPIIGIPLPFISKGGSSLLGFTLMMAVMLKMDSQRNRR